MSESTSSNRVILQQSHGAGLPISAPVVTRLLNPDFGDLRWVQRQHSFSLQVYDMIPGTVRAGWNDIPVVIDSSEEG